MKPLVQAITLGTTVIANIIFGTGLGYFLDRCFTTTPIFLITGILCGTVSAFFMLYKMVGK
ncbi:AtpZ/AtpI family protein [Anaerorhabdus sp.]|uniref:AtpZ/AtpI family protein n=1 Tax=Anaerorhabdus sp. TaxID=1872524 RepID=UPI002FC95788